MNPDLDWNQTVCDWQRVISLAPDTCFAFDDDCGRLAATATTLCYGKDLAWIGMVLTRPDRRRRGAFAMVRPGVAAMHFGPCVGRSPESAEIIVCAVLARHGAAALCWDLLPENLEVVSLARSHGFRLMRMVRGPQIVSHPALVYATAGFEIG